MAAKQSNTHQQPREAGLNNTEPATEGVFWVKATGLFQQANRRFCELLGYSEEALQSLRLCDLATDLSKSQWPHLWRQFREEKILHHQGGLATKTGEVVAVEIKACFLMFGGEELMCGFVREIGSRKEEAETLLAELQASEARFRTLYNNAPVMLQACDHETRIFIN